MVGGGVAIASLTVGYVGWAASSFLMHPKPLEVHDDPAHYGLHPQNVTFATPTVHQPLQGWFFKHPNDHHRAIIFLHGWRSSRQHMLKNYLSWLAKHYSVLAFDLANNGDSPTGVTTMGPNETQDARAAVHWLAKQGYDKVGVLGTSMGGACAILLAAQEPGVRAVVTDGAFASPQDPPYLNFVHHGYPLPGLLAWSAIAWLGWRTGTDERDAEAARHVGQISPRPLLIIHGDADHVIPPGDATALYAAAGEPKQLWLVPGADHMSEPDTCPHGLHPAEYERRVVALLDHVN
jgi:pimeloyl-ACP methyl ester carboxylesterase